MATAEIEVLLEKAMQHVRKTLKTWGLPAPGTSLGLRVRAQLDLEDLRGPRTAMIKAVDYLSDLLIPSSQYDSMGMGKGSWCMFLTQAGPVNFFFSCLPDPEAHEKGLLKGGMENKYSLAQEVLDFLVVVIGKDGMRAIWGGSLLNGLLSIRKRACCPDVSNNAAIKYRVWQDGLFHLALETCDKSHLQGDTSSYTKRLLQYFLWVVQGRKDLTCPVQKPWPSRIPAELNLIAQPDLASLFSSDTSASPGEFHKEKRDLFRRVRLFQDCFLQYLISLLTTQQPTEMVVSETHGVIRRNDPSRDVWDSINVDFSCESHLQFPQVQAVLHSLHCCAIQDRARALLEYFIRPACHSILLMHVIPKNAETTVEDESRYFNMAPAHTVGLLTIAPGLLFIFDPTAAQFGWKENLAPYDAYARQRIDWIVKYEVCEPLNGPCIPTIRTRRPSEDYREGWDAKCIAEEIVTLVEANLAEKGGLSGIFELSETEFEEQRLALKEALRESMPRPVVTGDFTRRAARDLQ